MKIANLIAVALLASAAAASAAEPSGAPARQKALMVYFNKSFGGTGQRRHQPLAFGLKLQQSDAYQDEPSFDLIDLRYSLGHRATLTLANAVQLTAFNDGKESSSSSSIGPSFDKNPVATVVVATVAIAGGLCLAKKVICKSKRSYNETTTTTPTGDSR